MMKWVWACLFVFVGINAEAQPASSLSKLSWDYVGATVTIANGFGENYYADAAVTGVPLTGKTCVVNAANATCTSPFPALTPGAHTLSVTATSSGLESPKSNVTSFTFVVLITPTNLRIGAKVNITIIPIALAELRDWHFSSPSLSH